jgi:hypothetical protein
MRLLRVILVACVVICGCRSSEAKSDFALSFSCPEHRIEVTRRKDLGYYDVHPEEASDQAPAELKDDPGRLALWQDQRRESMSTNTYEEVYEVAGCGHTSLYSCSSRPSCHEGKR